MRSPQQGDRYNSVKKDRRSDGLPKVTWGEEETTNDWRTKYLDSMFEAGGGCMTDVKIRITCPRQLFGKIGHIWSDKRIYFNLRLDYQFRVYRFMTYGSEA